MARAGIYKSEVVRARNNLLAMGRYPSVDAIRIELGNTGSKGTIHRYLKEIDEEDGDRTGPKVAVSEAIQDLSARLAERLHEEAEQRLAALTEKHNAQLTEMNNVIAALRNEVDGFRSQVERLTAEIATERAAHQETQSRSQGEKLTCTKTMQRVQDLEELRGQEEVHRLSLEEKHRHAREALDHFRTAAKEQREQDQRQFEQQIQFLQSELKGAKDALNAKQQELIRSHEDNARLSNEVMNQQHDTHRLETELRTLRTAKEQLGISEISNQHLAQRLDDATQQEAALKRENQENRERLQSALAASQALEVELASAKAVVAVQQAQIIQWLRVKSDKDADPVKTEKAGVQEERFGPKPQKASEAQTSQRNDLNREKVQ